MGTVSCTGHSTDVGGAVDPPPADHRRGQLLVDDRQAAAVVRRMVRSPRPPLAGPEPLPGLGVTRLHLAGPEAAWPVAEIVRQLQAERFRVAPNRVLRPASHINIRPASPPVPTTGRLPDLATQGEVAGHGVRVGVVDSGVWPEHPWLEGRVELRPEDREANPDGSPLDEDILDPEGEPQLRYYAGHGTFIAGVVLQHAPGATIVARRVFQDGEVDDVRLARHLLDLVDVDILTLSLGTRPGPDIEGGDALSLMVTSNSLIELRRRNPRLVILAPAGNDGRPEPVWPAAFSSVVAVAALDAFGKPAPFTNSGPWVDACALGDNVASAFLRWNGGLQPPVHHHEAQASASPAAAAEFHGWAHWSGTSFATPHVAGALAALMGEGMDAASAVAVVLRRPGVTRVPGCGVVVDPTPYFA